MSVSASAFCNIHNEKKRKNDKYGEVNVGNIQRLEKSPPRLERTACQSQSSRDLREWRLLEQSVNMVLSGM